ncbi:VOC family protein [Nocardia sp. CDC160]|uniref:VOC family protein n=1 Tax=Nocardia sp. CDC160 TaxID=3112166 RepID=UPI002DBC6821|nr:VOC family protein [Nocardia sp. CDC160]MEC3915967.1 VOC family protein [Nocardia sp. CDC160]
MTRTNPSNQHDQESTKMTESFQLAGISLDCDDPGLLARFYKDLLGGQMVWNNERSAGIRLPSGLTIIAQKVTGYTPPPWPGTSIVHLDLAANADLDECEKRALRCGATQLSDQPDPRWRVLLDPAGHPFCITTCTPPS